jgi:hypothetical protein
MPEELPPKIAKAKALLLESMRILDLHGTLRVRRRETHRGSTFVITLVVALPDPTSVRDHKRAALRQRG